MHTFGQCMARLLRRPSSLAQGCLVVSDLWLVLQLSHVCRNICHLYDSCLAGSMYKGSLPSLLLRVSLTTGISTYLCLCLSCLFWRKLICLFGALSHVCRGNSYPFHTFHPEIYNRSSPLSHCVHERHHDHLFHGLFHLPWQEQQAEVCPSVCFSQRFCFCLISNVLCPTGPGYSSAKMHRTSVLTSPEPCQKLQCHTS